MGQVLHYLSPEARFMQEKRGRKEKERKEEKRAKQIGAARLNVAASNLLTADRPTESLPASQILAPSDVTLRGTRKFRGPIPYGTPGYSIEKIERSQKRKPR